MVDVKVRTGGLRTCFSETGHRCKKRRGPAGRRWLFIMLGKNGCGSQMIGGQTQATTAIKTFVEATQGKAKNGRSPKQKTKALGWGGERSSKKMAGRLSDRKGRKGKRRGNWELPLIENPTRALPALLNNKISAILAAGKQGG